MSPAAPLPSSTYIDRILRLPLPHRGRFNLCPFPLIKAQTRKLSLIATGRTKAF